jgi:AAA domain-containing protein
VSILIKGVALEGGICAGKTVVQSALSVAYGFRPIPEYMAILSQDEARRAFDASNTQSIDLFAAAEQRRLPTTPGAVRYCLDRSFLTLAAYRYALRSLNLIGDEEVQYAANVLMGMSWLVPPVIVYLDTPGPIRARRSARRDKGKTMPPLLLDDGFNCHFREFFVRLERHGMVAILANDGADSVDVLAGSICALCNDKKGEADASLNPIAVDLMRGAGR